MITLKMILLKVPVSLQSLSPISPAGTKRRSRKPSNRRRGITTRPTGWIAIEDLEEGCIAQCVRGSPDSCKWHGCPFGNIQKRMSSVRHIEHPEQAHLKVFGRVAARIPVQSAPAKLWLPLRTEVDICAVVLEHLDYRQAYRPMTKPSAPRRLFEGMSPMVEYRPAIARSCALSMSAANAHMAISARFGRDPERASPMPSGTNRNTFSTEFTPPTDPQIRHQREPRAGAAGSGNKVANAMTGKPASVTPNPARRTCGAGATVTIDRGRADS